MILLGQTEQLERVGELKLIQDPCFMGSDRRFIEVEGFGDLIDGISFEYLQDYFKFPVGKRFEWIVLITVDQVIGNEFRELFTDIDLPFEYLLNSLPDLRFRGLFDQVSMHSQLQESFRKDEILGDGKQQDLQRRKLF
jgi:hypothetical protein